MCLGVPVGGTLQGGLLPAFRSLGRRPFARRLAPLLRGAIGRRLQRRLAEALRASRQGTLAGSLTTPPVGLVRVHHLVSPLSFPCAAARRAPSRATAAAPRPAPPRAGRPVLRPWPAPRS